MKEKELKVLHLFPEFLRGGSPVNTLRFVKATEEILTHAAAGKKVDPKLFDEYPPHAEPWDVDLTKPSPASLFKLRRLARDYRPDIIHANGKAGTFYGLYLSFCLPRKTKIFLTLRGFHDKFSGLKSRVYRTMEGMMARRADMVISVSPSERKHYLELIKADPAGVKVIPNGIDIKEQALPDEIGSTVKQYKTNIVSLSRITPQKDLITMIKSFTDATTGQKDTALHIMGGLTHGEEEYQREVEQILSASPARERIFFWGDVKQAGNLITYFDIYFSTARFEGLPTAVVEAFLSKTLVVGTDCIGNIDLIRDGETGLLAGTGKTAEITEALKQGLELLGSEEAEKMIAQAYKEGSEYSIENQARRLLVLYRGK